MFIHKNSKLSKILFLNSSLDLTRLYNSVRLKIAQSHFFLLKNLYHCLSFSILQNKCCYKPKIYWEPTRKEQSKHVTQWATMTTSVLTVHYTPKEQNENTLSLIFYILFKSQLFQNNALKDLFSYFNINSLLLIWSHTCTTATAYWFTILEIALLPQHCTKCA